MTATHQANGEFAVYNDDPLSDIDETQRGLIVAAVKTALIPFGGVNDSRTTAYINWYDTQE